MAGLGLDCASPTPTLPTAPCQQGSPGGGRQAPSETSIGAQVTGLASGQLLTSLDTQTQRLSFCRALCPETPNSQHADTWYLTSHKRTNSGQLTHGPSHRWGNRKNRRLQGSLPTTRPPPPEAYFYPVTEQSPYLPGPAHLTKPLYMSVSQTPPPASHYSPESAGRCTEQRLRTHGLHLTWAGVNLELPSLRDLKPVSPCQGQAPHPLLTSSLSFSLILPVFSFKVSCSLHYHPFHSTHNCLPEASGNFNFKTISGSFPLHSNNIRTARRKLTNCTPLVQDGSALAFVLDQSIPATCSPPRGPGLWPSSHSWASGEGLGGGAGPARVLLGLGTACSDAHPAGREAEQGQRQEGAGRQTLSPAGATTHWPAEPSHTRNPSKPVSFFYGF